MYPYFAYLALLQAISGKAVSGDAAPQPAGVALLDDCSESASVLAHLPTNAAVDVRSSVIGYAMPCYSLTASVDGKQMKGFVLGSGLDAVAEFEHKKAVYLASIVTVPPPPPQAQAPNAAMTPATPPATTPGPTGASSTPAPEKTHYPVFPDFSATDMRGRAVSSRSLHGKVNLICFWTPSGSRATQELLAINQLNARYRNQGLEAIALSLTGNQAKLRDAVGDYALGFPNVPNGFPVAQRYNIAYEELPRTYVLNADHEIVSSGLHGKALEALVKKLIDEK